jgi:hypothetical protein
MHQQTRLNYGIKVTYKQLERYCGGGYVGDEIFGHVKWFNERPVTNPAGAGCLADWDYSFRALLVVVPAFSDRILKA